ncbi:enoyl-CoA hydratase/isomerase [Aquimarina sp. I32.4]|uniref:enoyl-CoA hydratase/isomerase n=1 Tax=Aquimarina sp. I32.4 TaxID=2053903 RepID=UPI000CDF0148|nr:enoyl-CoA hydratase/isomerase [Aquimarina sp. I32.4]
MNTLSTIEVIEKRGVLLIKLSRPEANNSINTIFIKEILKVFIYAEKNTLIKIVVLEGNQNVFCTGMDFNSVISEGRDASIRVDSNEYYNMLKYISFCSKIIIAKVDGKVNAGGIGIIAASDIVIAGGQATFGLSEALFGLLPACVMPFLIKRIGVQKAQWMTLMTQEINSKRAYEIGLVDEITSNTENTLRRSVLRLLRLESSTVLDLKDYMSKLWIISDDTQKLAVDKITSLVESEKVQSNIKNFVENGKFPWDK